MTAKTWSGSSGDWSTASGWSPTGVPGSGDDAAVTGTVVLTTDDGAIRSLTDSGSVDFKPNGALDIATTLMNSGFLGLGDSPGSATGGSTLVVGGQLSNTGTFTLGDDNQTAGTISATLGSLSNGTTGKIKLLAGTTAAKTVSLVINSTAGFGTGTTLTGSVDLEDNASIDFTGGGSLSAIAAASSLTLVGAAASIFDQGSGPNSALSGLGSVAGTLELYGGSTVTTTTGLTNTGKVRVDDYVVYQGGSSLTIGGTFTNASSAAYGALDIGDNDTEMPTAVTIEGGVTNSVGNELGSITLEGGRTASGETTLTIQSAAGFNSGSTVTGVVNLSGYSSIQFTGGGSISGVASNSTLILNGPNATISIDGMDDNSALAGLGTNAGDLDLEDGASLTLTGGLANTGVLQVDFHTTSGGGGTTLSVGSTGPLTNSGTIYVGSVGLTSATALDVGAGGLDDMSTSSAINVTGTTTGVFASINVNTAAGFGTAGELTGNVTLLNDARINFASGQITDIEGGLELNGANAAVSNDGTDTNSALVGLTKIGAGGLELTGGSTLTITGSLTDNGNLYIDNGSTFSTSAAGSLSVGGSVTIGDEVFAQPVMASPATVNVGAGGLVNYTGSGSSLKLGQIQIQSGGALASLDVNTAAGFGTTGQLDGSVALSDNAQIQFASGEITTIASDGGLSIQGAQASILDAGGGVNSALTGLTTIAGGLTIAGGASVTTGTATGAADTLTIGNNLSVTGTGTVNVSNIDIAAGGTFDIGAAGSIYSVAPITFAGSSAGIATLVLEATPATGSTYADALVDFGKNDRLDLSGLTYKSGATATYSSATGLLTVRSNGVTELFTLTTPTATRFTVTKDASGGSLVSAVCFAAGTRIRTSRGDVAVEHLAVGDLVETTSGSSRPIRWLGHRRLDCRRHRRPHEARPIRITAHAFGPNRPVRELLVSPGHAICVDVLGETLIPAGALVNGATIAQLDVDAVTYWHVELDSHDVILAENLPAESYIDMGNRDFFSESGVIDLAAGPDGVGRDLASDVPPRAWPRAPERAAPAAIFDAAG